MEVLSVDGINEDLPQVALLFHLLILLLLLLLHQTHDIKSSLPGGTPNVIFTPDDSMAYIIDLTAVLLSEFISFCRSNKIWKIITMMDTRVKLVIEIYQRRLHEKIYVPSTTFGRTMLVAGGVVLLIICASHSCSATTT